MQRAPVTKNSKRKHIKNVMTKVNKERKAFKKGKIPPIEEKAKQMRKKLCRREDLGRVLGCIGKTNEFAMKCNPVKNIEKVETTNGRKKVIKEKNSLKWNAVKAVKQSDASPTQETVKQRKQNFCKKEDVGQNKKALFRCFERKIQRAVTVLENALLNLPETSNVHKKDSTLNEDTTNNYETCKNALGEDTHKQEDVPMSSTE